MPYIKAVDRARWSSALAQILPRIHPVTPKGELNYLISQLIIARIGDNLSYAHLSETRDVLLDVWDEVGRKVLHPYEDLKISENGDLPWPKFKKQKRRKSK